MAPKTFAAYQFASSPASLQARFQLFVFFIIFFLYFLLFENLKASRNPQRNCLGSGINYSAQAKTLSALFLFFSYLFFIQIFCLGSVIATCLAHQVGAANMQSTSPDPRRSKANQSDPQPIVRYAPDAQKEALRSNRIRGIIMTLIWIR